MRFLAALFGVAFVYGVCGIGFAGYFYFLGQRSEVAWWHYFLTALALGILANALKTIGELIGETGLVATVVIVAIVFPVGCVLVILDDWMGLSLYPEFFLGVLAVATLVALPLCVGSRQRAYWLIPALFGLLLGILTVVDLNPVKPAVRLVTSIRPGMTEAEVRSAFELLFPEHGRFKRPRVGTLHRNPYAEPAHDRSNRLMFFVDPADGRYDWAVVEVFFENGLTTTARFLPD